MCHRKTETGKAALRFTAACLHYASQPVVNLVFNRFSGFMDFFNTRMFSPAVSALRSEAFFSVVAHTRTDKGFRPLCMLLSCPEQNAVSGT